MSNAPSRDMKDLLVAASVGVFGVNPDADGWSIFIGNEPDEPDNTITIYDTPGEAPHPKFRLDYPRFQVRVRCRTYDAGWLKIEEVKSALLGLPSQTINGTIYEGIWAVTESAFLLRDGRNRSVFTSTWRIIREPTTGTNRLEL